MPYKGETKETKKMFEVKSGKQINVICAFISAKIDPGLTPSSVPLALSLPIIFS